MPSSKTNTVLPSLFGGSSFSTAAPSADLDPQPIPSQHSSALATKVAGTSVGETRPGDREPSLNVAGSHFSQNKESGEQPETEALPRPNAIGRRTPGGASQEFLTAKQLLVEFLEDYLEIIFVGFQSRFGQGSDLILFRSPNSGSTLAIECNILLEPRTTALQIVRSKLLLNDIKFARTR